MRRKFLWLVGGCAVVLVVLTLVAAQHAPTVPAVRTVPDLVFCQPGGTPLHLDLAMPASGGGPFPAVLCLHGGGWVAGDRKQMAQTIEVLARRGYVAVAP